MTSSKVRKNAGHVLSNATFVFLLTVLVFVLILGPFGLSRSQAYVPRTFPFCTNTAKAASTACDFEAEDDYWIAVGNCNNVSDRGDRTECLGDAEDELLEATEACSEQLDARIKICRELGEEPYDPEIDPAEFVDPSEIGSGVYPNPYFPLVPGTVWVYEGETDEGFERITVTVSEETKEIEYPEGSGQIFTCVVVLDTVELDGEVIEDTYDWYAQDADGNVWYFGEISQEFEDGELVSLEGSWKSGKDSAKPGIVMFSNPVATGVPYRQEFFLGDAEDMAEVENRGVETVTVPYGMYTDDILKTREWTPIDPDVLEFKYYAPGVGMVLEVNPDTGERVELVNMSTPGEVAE